MVSVLDFCETRSFVAVCLSDLQAIVDSTALVTQASPEMRIGIELCVCVFVLNYIQPYAK